MQPFKCHLIIIINFQKKAELMKHVLAPIAAKFPSLMESMVVEKDENKQLAYAQSLNNAMALAR